MAEPPLQASMLRLFPPRAAPGAIIRDRILKQVFDNGSPPVVVIQAPAGHGKSTLMQQIKSESDDLHITTGWLTLDEADNDLSRFYRDLRLLFDNLPKANAKTSTGTASSKRKSRSFNERSRGREWFLDRLIALNRPVSLFIDEFQTLSNPAAIAFFRKLLEMLPPNVRFFISSRTAPEFGLASLMISNQALVIRAAELMFSRKEVEAFFAKRSKLELSHQEIDSIYRKTEGWPAALQLYLLSLRHSEVRSSLANLKMFQPRQLAEYLSDNVLSLQPSDIQSFLLETSILIRMSGPLCDAVCDRTDSAELLSRLEAAGLFVRSLDASMKWFEYHSLFSSFLVDQFQQLASARISEIHDRAAKWFYNEGYFEEAIYHALETHDVAFAASCLDNWATQLVMEGNLATVETWYHRLPINELSKYPKLIIKVAWALTFRRRQQTLEEILGLLDRNRNEDDNLEVNEQNVIRSMICILHDDIEQAFDFVRPVEVDIPQCEAFTAFELGAAANLKGYLALTSGDFEQAREYLSIGLSYGENAHAAFSLGYSVATAAENLMIQGQLGEALKLFQQAQSESHFGLEDSVASASLAACHIHALYEANDFDEAQVLFEQSHQVIAEAALIDYLAVAYISMVRLYDAIGKLGKSSELLDEVEGIAHTTSWPRLLRIIAWERVRRATLAGDVGRARSLASRIPDRATSLPEDWIPFSEDTEGDAIGKIRLAIHERRMSTANRMIDAELSRATRFGRTRRKIKLLTLSAIAHYFENSGNAAHRSLRHALQLAEPGGYMRLILDEGSTVVELLREEYQSTLSSIGNAGESDPIRDEPHCRMVESLLKAAGVDLERTENLKRQNFQLLEPLSTREEEILRLLADGMTNLEISERAYVSENTVKFHLKNIYSKLGVTSRLKAIGMARELHLL